MGFRKTIQIYGVGGWHRLTQTRTVKNKNLLLIQLTSLGDACTLIPFAKQFEAEGYALDIAAQAGLEPLWKRFVNVRNFFPMNAKTLHKPMDSKQRHRLQHLSYAVVFSTSISPWGAYLAALPTTGQRIGMIENGARYTGSHLYTDFYNTQGDEHVTRRFFELFRLALPEFQAPIFLETASNSEGDILIQPGAKWKLRRWPAERYWSLAQRLSEKGFSVTVLVHESEQDLVDYFQSQPNKRNIQILQTQNLEHLIQMVEHCRLFIGNDSGPVHLANLLGKLTVVLWGPGHLERIRPLGENVSLIVKPIECRPCKQYGHPDRCTRGENECLLEIEVDEVEEVVLGKLR